MVAVTERCKDNNGAVKTVLTGRLKVGYCDERVLHVTSRRDKVGRELFNVDSRGVGKTK